MVLHERASAIKFTKWLSGAFQRQNMDELQSSELSNVIRLLIRSALLGSLSSPIINGDFWSETVFQAVSGICIGLGLYIFEKFMWSLQKRSSSNTARTAAYRGAALLFVLTLAKFGDVGKAVGSALTGALFAFGLYGL